jgi:hypothetical protein
MSARHVSPALTDRRRPTGHGRHDRSKAMRPAHVREEAPRDRLTLVYDSVDGDPGKHACSRLHRREEPA